MALNKFQLQTLFEKKLAFQWEANSGLGDQITWKNDIFKAQDQPGASFGLRRPSRVTNVNGGIGVDYSLPGTTQPTVGYTQLQDATVQLTLTTRLEANIQASMEDLVYNITDPDIEERYIKPAIVDIQNQQNLLVAQAVALAAGQSITVGTAFGSGVANTAQNFLQALQNAESALIQRAAASENERKILVQHMGVAPLINPGAATLYNYGSDPRMAQASGRPIPKLGGFDVYRSPLLNSLSVTAPGTLTVAAPGSGVTNGLTSWAQTWQLNVTGWSQAPQVGSIIAISGVDWVVPGLNTDTGIQATFAIQAATLVSGSNYTLTLSEPLVYSGVFRNTTLSAAVATGTTVTLVQSGATLRPSYAFVPKAIVGSSPEVAIPRGVAYGKNFKAAQGFNFAVIEDHWPGTLQNITKLVAISGVAVPLPEGVVQIVGI